jgi:AcrR family transcriptional regulator
MCPRKYDTRGRQAAAEVTRRRILDATRSIIAGQDGVPELSMGAVAAKAGVARMTVYYQFGSRPGLLEAFADRLGEQGGLRERMPGVFLEPDPERAVRKFVEAFVGFWASDRVILRKMRALAVVVPELFEGTRGRDRWRREAARNLLHRVSRGNGNRRAPPPKGAADLLTALTAFEVFDLLCEEGRSADAVAEQLGDAAVRLLGLGR